jgi:predicted acyl esterase
MTTRAIRTRGASLVLLAGLLLVGCAQAPEGPVEKVSRFGEYSGYSEPVFSHFYRSSVYVEVRDGVRLAVDTYLPGDEAGPADAPLPTILMSSRYPRASRLAGGGIDTPVGDLPAGQSSGRLVSRNRDGTFTGGRESIPFFMEHGYAFVKMQARGTGASEGVRLGEGSWPEVLDHRDVIEWLAGQPWSDGNVGMIGGSWVGWSQLQAAASQPEQLRAIFPAVPSGDSYRSVAPNGVLQKNVIYWALSQSLTDIDTGNIHVPVDEDVDGSRLRAILDERRARTEATSISPSTSLVRFDPDLMTALGALAGAAGLASIREVPPLLLDSAKLGALISGSPELQKTLIAKVKVYRDTFPGYASFDEVTTHPFTILDRINGSGVPIYLWSGWFDGATDSHSFLYQNLTTPKRLTFGGFAHSPYGMRPREAFAQRTLNVEALRWFDYWLKGIENGIADEPPVRFAVMVGDDDMAWHEAPDWPPPGISTLALHFADGPSGSIRSINDGLLVAEPPKTAGVHRQTVDYTATTGPQTRYWKTMQAVTLDYSFMKAHGENALTYTTQPLEADVTVVGAPVVTISTTANAPDADYFVYLEEVDGAGEVTYVTDGRLRASFRTLGEPLYEVGSLPWPDCRRAVVEATPPLDAGVAELKFDLMPTGHRFDAGHRIRVVITHADEGNAITVPMTPTPTVEVLFGGDHGSFLELPVMTEGRSDR